MRILPILGGIAAAILFFFAVIFALASSYVGLTAQAAQSRVLTSAILFVVGLAVIVGVGIFISRKPKTVIQQLEISGQMKAAQIKRPNCGGSISANEIKIVSGVPYVKCPYCGPLLRLLRSQNGKAQISRPDCSINFYFGCFGCKQRRRSKLGLQRGP